MRSALTSKINQVLKTWPYGTVALSSWLESKGIYQQLAHKYEQTAWLERVGHGAFIRAGDKVEWPGALYAIQQYAKLPIHVGAKTALELQGHSHFVALGKKKVYLFGASQSVLPTWFKKKDWGVGIRFQAPRLFSHKRENGLTEKAYGSFSIRIASLERAILELLYLVPGQQSYEEAKLLFEGLQGLRPKLVQSLLESCRSIKVKRLFLHLSEEVQHPWFKELKTSRIDLGRGKRTIGEGGRFDSKYDISVPKIREGGSAKDIP